MGATGKRQPMPMMARVLSSSGGSRKLALQLLDLDKGLLSSSRRSWF
jgi:hypothetical protein